VFFVLFFRGLVARVPSSLQGLPDDIFVVLLLFYTFVIDFSFSSYVLFFRLVDRLFLTSPSFFLLRFYEEKNNEREIVPNSNRAMYRGDAYGLRESVFLKTIPRF